MKSKVYNFDKLKPMMTICPITIMPQRPGSVRCGDEAEFVVEFFGGGGGVVEVLPALGEVEWRDAVGKVKHEVAVRVIDSVVGDGDYKRECKIGHLNYTEAFG